MQDKIIKDMVQFIVKILNTNAIPERYICAREVGRGGRERERERAIITGFFTSKF
jgi:hypothetical protein